MNLSETVRAVLDEYDDNDPELLADIVIGRLEDYETGSVMRVLMAAYVRSFISRSRGGALPPAPSSKVTGVRESFQSDMDRWLRDRISIAPNTYKMRGDCTAADLRYAANLRAEIATKNAVAAEQYAVLADLLDEVGAEFVRDLPADAALSLLAA